MNPEDFWVRFELTDNAIRQVEHMAVDDIELPVCPGEPCELLRQLRARHERDDDAGEVLRIEAATTRGLVVELVVTRAGVRPVWTCFRQRLAVGGMAVVPCLGTG